MAVAHRGAIGSSPMGDGPSMLPNADYKSRSQAIASIAEKFGCSRATLRDWVNRQAVEDGDRDGLTQPERDELKALQRENRELEQANEILRKGEAFVRSPVHCATGSGNHWRRSEELPVVAPLVRAPLATDERFFRGSGPRPPTEEMIMFIDDHRGEYGGEPLERRRHRRSDRWRDDGNSERQWRTRSARSCRSRRPPITTTRRSSATRRKDPLRAQRDTELGPKIKACWEASGKRYGAVKVWYDLAAEGKNIARCTVVRLMKEMGIQGLRHWARTVAHRARTMADGRPPQRLSPRQGQEDNVSRSGAALP